MDLLYRYVKMIGIWDIIDILIVAFVFYQIIKLIKETRAQTLVKGILLLLVVMQLSGWVHLNTINYLLRNIMQFSAFALIVVFQPEIRRVLDMVGRSKITKATFFNFDTAVKTAQIDHTIEEISHAVMSMSATQTGALIVLEKETKIGEVISTGTSLDAEISSELIRNIFYPNTALHDGAMVIRDNRINAAGCFLPLSQQDGISKELGTRHRAALGMSECSDALIIVVSEETGRVSIAQNGSLHRNLTQGALESVMRKFLTPPAKKEKQDALFGKRKGEGQ